MMSGLNCGHSRSQVEALHDAAAEVLADDVGRLMSRLAISCPSHLQIQPDMRLLRFDSLKPAILSGSAPMVLMKSGFRGTPP